MRRSEAAIALIRREQDGQTLWLAQWNEGWHALSFVGGHRHDDESFRDCMIRELEEELGLREGADVLVPAARSVHLEYTAVSRRTREETEYVLELFDVTLVGGRAIPAIDGNPANRWLSEPEIMACQSHDGRPVSETPRRLLSSLGWDLFVSYAHADDHDGWVTELITAIRAEHAEFTPTPLRVFFDRDEIRSMDDWQRRIYDGLHASTLMLAVLSEAYFRSDYCHREWEVYRYQEARREMLGESIAPIYIVTVPEFEGAAQGAIGEWPGDLRQRADLARRQYLDIRPWRPHGVAALREVEVRRRLKQLDQQLADRLARARQLEASRSTVPRASDRFVGRHRELAHLRELLPQGKVAAITAVQGIGGIGKTALAFMYAQAFADHYPGGRFLVEAAGLDDLRLVLMRLVSDLGVVLTDPEQRDLDMGAARVRAVLEQRARSLLVLDNVDRPELLAPLNRARFLPRGDRVHLLVTTRLEEGRLTAAAVDCLPLESLPAPDALELLNRHRAISGDDEWKAALRIAGLLGGHTLALEVVAVYLWKHPDVSYGDYLVRLEGEGVFPAMTGTGQDPLVAGQLSEHPESLIGPLLEPTLRSLAEPELRVLEYAAAMAPDSVAWPWLHELVAEEFPDDFQRIAGHGDPLRETERRLHGLRLLTRTDSPNLARMHRIVQAVLVGRMPAADRVARSERASRYALARAERFAGAWSGAERSWECTSLRDFGLLAMQHDDPRAVYLVQWLAEPLQYLTSVAEAVIVLRQAVQCGQRLASSHPGNAGWQRDVSVSQENIGDVLRAQGDLTSALSSYRASLEIRQRLASSDPGNAGWQRDLSVNHNKIGDVLSEQGDLTAALASYRGSLEIRHRLASSDPGDAGWQRDLSVSQEKIGDVLRAQGDLTAALASYRGSLEISQGLASSDPGNAGWQRDLSVSHNKIGDLVRAQGDLTRALSSYRSSLEIIQRLASSDPGNAGWQRDLSVSHSNIGDVLRAQGNLTAAVASHGASLEIIQRLASSDPGNAGWQRDLSVSHNYMGNVLSAQGDLTAGLASYRAYQEIIQRLASSDPGNAGWQRDLSVSHNKIGDVLSAQGDLTAALASYRASLEIIQRLASSDPGNAGWQRDVWVSCWRIANLLEQRGDPHAEAWWRRTYETLSDMVRRGLFVSEADRRALEQLQARFGR
jgi:tetratricopeptide (TPR) repeat protein/8-oxo-dGTP pyrophosphatase MutT (NUDIX family)